MEGVVGKCTAGHHYQGVGVKGCGCGIVVQRFAVVDDGGVTAYLGQKFSVSMGMGATYTVSSYLLLSSLALSDTQVYEP